MNKSAESRTRQFEAASAGFSAVISTVRRNLTRDERPEEGKLNV